MTVLVVLGLVVPRISLGLDLRVQGESQLEAGVRSAGTRLVVSGALRDDLRQPLSRRPIRVEVRAPDTDEPVATRTTDTSRRGTFSIAFDVPPGSYEVEMRFEATDHVAGASTTESISVVPEPMELTLEAPEVVRPPVDAITLSATLLVDGMGVPAEGFLEINGDRVRSIDFDASGLVRLDVADRLQPGGNRVRVVIPDGQHREGTEAELQIEQLRDVTFDATVSKVFDRLQRGLEVQGRVSGEVGKIADANLEVTLRYQGNRPPRSRDSNEGGREDTRTSKATEVPTRQVETDEEGRFEAFFERSRLQDGPWRADLRLIPDVGDPFEHSVGTVRVDRTFTRWVARGAGLLALLALAVVGGRELWWLVRRKLRERRERREAREARERAFEREDELAPVRLDEVVEEESRSERSLFGRVRNVWRDEPVVGADVALHPDGEGDTRLTSTDEAGEFAWNELPDGTYTLEIRSDRFVDGRHTFSIPHDGTLAGARFDVVPVPLKIRRLYQALIEMIRGDDLWGELSPRAIESVIQEELDTRVEGDGERPEGAENMASRLRDLLDDPDHQLDSTADYLEALTDIVEETYFSQRTYTEETWELARRLALRLRDVAEQQGEVR